MYAASRKYFTNRQISLYFGIFVIPIGIFFNTVSMVVFCSKRLNNKTNTGYLSAGLCLVNSMALTVQIIICIYNMTDDSTYTVVSSSNAIAHSAFACRVFGFSEHFFFHIPSIYQMIMSIDVFTTVRHPHQFKWLKTKKGMGTFILSTVFVVFLLNIPHFFYSFNTITNLMIGKNKTIVSNRTVWINETHIIDACTMKEGIMFTLDLMHVFIRGIIPFVIMFVMNSITVRHLFVNKKKLGSTVGKKEYLFAVSVIPMNVAFLILFLPWNFLYYYTHSSLVSNLNEDPDTLGTINFYLVIADSVAYFNNYSPFFFSIIFNNLFRDQVFKGILKVKSVSKVIDLIPISGLQLPSIPIPMSLVSAIKKKREKTSTGNRDGSSNNGSTSKADLANRSRLSKVEITKSNCLE
jgi:hypothetical protein